MKSRIIDITKKIKIIYWLYYFFGSIVVSFLKLFVKVDDKLILFVSFGGRKYDDSPRYIYEKLLLDKRFNDYKLIWAFNEPNSYILPKGKKVRIDTLKYYLTALKAKYWITNSSIERGLNFKNKKTYYINTWHGTPMKFLGSDLSSDSESFKSRKKSKINYMTVQGNYESEIFSRVFNIDNNKLLNTGLPRNDVLSNYTVQDKNRILNKLGLPKDKEIILYAPTYREFNRDAFGKNIFKTAINFDEWKKKLGDKYVILIRMHYVDAENIEFNSYSSFLYDVSTYPELNELMIISDYLISDYSSIFFDYSILNKPMLHYTYDYDEYNSKRGLYFDIRDYVNGSSNEKELLRLLEKTSKDELMQDTKKFREAFIQYYGDSTNKVLNHIYNLK